MRFKYVGVYCIEIFGRCECNSSNSFGPYTPYQTVTPPYTHNSLLTPVCTQINENATTRSRPPK